MAPPKPWEMCVGNQNVRSRMINSKCTYHTNPSVRSGVSLARHNNVALTAINFLHPPSHFSKWKTFKDAQGICIFLNKSKCLIPVSIIENKRLCVHVSYGLKHANMAEKGFQVCLHVNLVSSPFYIWYFCWQERW